MVYYLNINTIVGILLVLINSNKLDLTMSSKRGRRPKTNVFSRDFLNGQSKDKKDEKDKLLNEKVEMENEDEATKNKVDIKNTKVDDVKKKLNKNLSLKQHHKKD